MTKTLEQKISVMQAALDGKEIELKDACGCIWEPLEKEEPVWNWDDFDYRIKPEPMEFWVNVYEGFEEIYPHKTKNLALAAADKACIKTIKVREVTDE